MKRIPWVRGSLSILLSAAVGGCAQSGADRAFTVRQIDSAPGDRGTVRIKLTTPGDIAEADESLLVNYVRVIAVREATKRQRQIADERARSAFRKRQSASRAAAPKSRYLAVETERSVPSERRAAPEKHAAAVPERNADSAAPRPARSVMIWDTQSQSVVGNNVYEVESVPTVGSVARFETYSAEYVGAGL